MSAFQRTFVDDRSFIRGAARLLVAPYSQARPQKISDVIALASSSGPPVVAQYDAQPGWTDLGATKTGLQISVNNSEESFDVDQILTDIDTMPTGWTVSVGTELAEMTPERLQIAWEGSAITVDASTTPNEQQIGFGAPVAYTKRRLAVLFQRPSGLIRGYFFHKVQRMAQESAATHNKTGAQISIPVRFNVMAETSITDIYSQLFIIRDQSIPGPGNL